MLFAKFEKLGDFLTCSKKCINLLRNIFVRLDKIRKLLATPLNNEVKEKKTIKNLLQNIIALLVKFPYKISA